MEKIYKPTYVLITTAFNEDKYLEQTILSVLNQTILPSVWVIVDDGSSDNTKEIILKYSKKHSFIKAIIKPEKNIGSMEDMVKSQIYGYSSINYTMYDFIGFLDADITINSNYFYELLMILKKKPEIGVTGGIIFEKNKGVFAPREYNSDDWVAGAVQTFRVKCFEEIGGLRILKYGGQDTMANCMAEYHGWEVSPNKDLIAFHHRMSGSTGQNVLTARFKLGKRDYSIGYHPIYEIAKNIKRILEKPVLLSSIYRILGYFRLYYKKEKILIDKKYLEYIRNRQIIKLKSLIKKK